MIQKFEKSRPLMNSKTPLLEERDELVFSNRNI